MVLNTGGSRVHFELVNDYVESLKAFTQYPTKIRALRVLESDKTGLYMSFLVFGRIGDYRSDVLWSAEHLRVLDLCECSIMCWPTSIRNLKQLRYLNAPRVKYETSIPNCITKLQQLIFLSLRRSLKISSLPDSIGEMESLMHLDLSGCSGLQKLPVSFGKLKSLMHLDLSGCSGLQKLPVSFGKLKSLVHLDMSDCSRVRDVSESLVSLTNLEYLNLSGCLRIGQLPKHLGSLLQLRNLNLSYSSYAKAGVNIESFVALSKLECLNLASENCFVKKVHTAFSSLTNLKYLNLSGCHAKWVRMAEEPIAFGNLKNLVYLDLSRCNDVCDLPETLAFLTNLQHLNLSKWRYLSPSEELLFLQISEPLGNLIELRYLNLSEFFNLCARTESISIVLECISNLSNLEHLDLSGNWKIKSIPDSFRSLRKLHTLDLWRCSSLDNLPAFVVKMDSLRFLNFEGGYESVVNHHTSEQPGVSKSLVRLPHFVVQANCHDSSSSLVLLQDVNCTNLVLSKLENVKSVQEAPIIGLKKKVGMKEMSFNWTEDAERSVQDMELLGELVPPITLEKLKIDGYSSVRLPEWFVGSIVDHLPNLVWISMSNLPRCNSLPPLGQLPNLKELVLERMNSISKIDWDICGTTRPPFPRLLYDFTMREMESLEVWYTTYSADGDDGVREFMLPNLCDLEIDDCPNLRLEPCPPTAQRRWQIWRSEAVLSSWGEGGSHTSVSSPSSSPEPVVHVRLCEVPMHQWRLLHHLPGLTKLKIYTCSDLSSSPEITQALSSLRSLTLEGGFDQPESELPNWLGELASLKELTIKGNCEVKALQDSMGNLTRLQSLCLNRIKSMTALPQWVGDLVSLQQLELSSCPNLNDLTESIGGLTSLNELKIRYCDRITSLPESIGGLTSLNKISIRLCDSFTSLTESIKQLTNLEKLEIISKIGDALVTNEVV